MRLEDFAYDLPEDRIALHPARPRDAARLLVVRPGRPPEDRGVRDLPALLAPGDLVVFNDTRVIPARLFARRAGHEGRIEILLHRPAGGEGTWEAFARPARKLKPGTGLIFDLGAGEKVMAEVTGAGAGGIRRLAFADARDVERLMARAGGMPLPPYIARRRAPDAEDRARYQTVFARLPGSVAAPTAGLHFTPRLLAALEERGVRRAFVTLHVGAGTFLPVKTEDVRDHPMHAEWGHVPAPVAALINMTRAGGGRVVAVGTTVVRLLESAADEAGRVHPFAGETDLFILPGYRFRAIDLMITNFHLPRSTLLMLVSAFSGVETIRAAYAHAVESGYRFYSYGDATLLFPEEGA
ncbi:MAG: S-adenosylmethionine:tRNA ribosyltransferase-isomerase [Rhodothalassiaceae bacterium]|nr:MAG: S-adenosylmethionine:tRNA ribosyltransferase-isomerase [Rhodothalassiaceae bacterium]